MRFVRKWAFIAFLFSTLIIPQRGFSERKFVTLVVGQSKVLSAVGVKSVAVGDSSILSVKVLPGGNEIMLTGLKPGITNVILLYAGERKVRYSVQVLASDPEAIAEAIRGALKGIEGVGVKVVGSNVILEGEILKKEDEELVNRVLKTFPGVISLIKKKRLLPELMIQLDVKLVEISSSSNSEFGFEWPFLFGGEGRISFETKKTPETDGFENTFKTTIISNLSAGLKLLWQTGNLRVLSNPVLITGNGEKARFLAGGEIPVITSGSLGQINVEYKEFGVLLEFTPKADAYGDVSLNLKVSVSDVDYSNAVQASGFTIPALTKREASAKVNLKENQSLALAELLTEREKKNVSKVPFLGHIPIIGELFKSRAFQKGKSHFMVFITPTIVKPDELPADRIRKMLREYEEYRNEVRAGILD